ncbi:hypothetical protein PBI_WALRUS_67 [Gordonia phage Walrus]|uniref:Uncharacterized protein n=1 Tax=Gordonia phage Walrus TaxID=2517927 RepID=A0A481S1R2_9CAUD|nr:hypothetical protein KNU50_gp67 [Gordonia phage Walrus]QBG78458.1 hypothetical protein PBI_WALRUS_67 [Gordonia phage Walrus]
MANPEMKPLPGVLTTAERIRNRRCLWCEWHPPTQSHHPDCPTRLHDHTDEEGSQ